MENFVFEGIVAAPFLPMNEDESIDWKSLQSYYRWIAAQRPTAIAINMDASEGSSLTREEQLEVLRATLEAVDGACPVLSGVMASFTADAVRWGNELKRAGAQGLVVFPPLPVFLGNPLPAEMVVRHHAAIGGIGLPFVAFQLPKGEGPDLSADVMRELVQVPELHRREGSVLRRGADDRVDRHRRAAAPEARHPHGERPVHPGGDAHGVRRGPHRVRRHGHRGADPDARGRPARATSRRPSGSGTDSGRSPATAGGCPERDYRPRMKEVLVMQGLIRSAAVRAPQMGIGDAERAELRRLARHAGLIAGA